MTPDPSGPLAVERIVVRADRVVVHVRVADPALARTDRRIAARALGLRPHLARHACVNEAGDTFGACIAQTSLAHLFEHLAIDLMCDASADAAFPFTGFTRADDPATGRFCVQLAYESDLAALAAIREAAALVNACCRPERKTTAEPQSPAAAIQPDSASSRL